MKKGHLLIIDDEAHLLSVLSFMLGAHAEKISLAETAHEALKFIDSEHVDCILCDINLPRMSGFDILRNVRDKGLRTVFIFFTAENGHEAVQEAVKLGADDFFFKPQFTGIESAVIAALNGLPYEADPSSEFGRLRLGFRS
jgi:CheY-like chemotaxis protein